MSKWNYLFESDAAVTKALKNLRNNPEDIRHWKQALQAANRNGKELQMYLKKTLWQTAPDDFRVVTDVHGPPRNTIITISSDWFLTGKLPLSTILSHGIKEVNIV